MADSPQYLVAPSSQGIAAADTHGVARVGHAVRALFTDGASPLQVGELAYGLSCWSARWEPVTVPPDFPDPVTETHSAADHLYAVKTVLEAIPRISRRQRGLRVMSEPFS